MDIQALKDLINKNTKDGLTELRKQTAKDKNVEKWTNEFKGDHAILKDPNKRDITVGEGTQSRVVKKARQIVKYQKKITNTAISFLLGASPDLILRNIGEKEEAGFQFILDLWKDAKLDYFSRELMRTVCIETEAAELWYTRETQNGYKIRPMLISEGQGYEFGPYFDDMGDMIAFWYMPKTGDKVKNQVYVPLWIKKEKVWIKYNQLEWISKIKPFVIACLRGLTDTDGSIYVDRFNKIIGIGFKNASLRLVKDFKSMCESLYIRTGKITESPYKSNKSGKTY